MVLGPNGVWMDGVPEEEDTVSWARNPDSAEEADPVPKQDDISMSMSFKSMLDSDAAATWYFNPQQPAHQQQPLHDLSAAVALHQQPPPDLHGLAFLDSSSSACSPTQQPFLAFDLDPETSLHFLPPFNPPNLLPNPNSNPNATGAAPPELGTSMLGFFEGFDGPSNLSPPMFFNRPKVLRPLEVLPQMGAQPTLFQKRAAKLGISGGSDFGELDNKRKRVELDVGEIDGDDLVSGFNYESDEGNDPIMSGACGKIAIGGGDSSGKNETSVGNNSTVTGGADQRGKKKGLPAKNLMAERRRRKKLNDRLYMLRSVVPKISKVQFDD